VVGDELSSIGLVLVGTLAGLLILFAKKSGTSTDDDKDFTRFVGLGGLKDKSVFRMFALNLDGVEGFWRGVVGSEILTLESPLC